MKDFLKIWVGITALLRILELLPEWALPVIGFLTVTFFVAFLLWTLIHDDL